MTIVTPHATPQHLRTARSRLHERAHDRGHRAVFRVYSGPMRLAVGFVLVVGCGNVTATPDAPVVDMPMIDMFLGAHRHFVMDHQTVPANNAEAKANSLDVDGDGDTDNQFGNVLAALSGQGFDVKMPTNTAVDQAAIVLLFDLQAPDLTTAAAAAFTSYFGTNPQPPACADPSDTLCRHHLDGTATFALSPSSPLDPPLTGAIAAGVYQGGPGKLPIQVAPIGPTMPLELVGARVKLSNLTDTTIGTGIIAGGIPAVDVDSKIIPSAATAFEAMVTRDCSSTTTPPSCGCIAGSQGSTAIGLFDTSPQDCRIVEDEVRNNALIQALLAPDVTLEGEPALSFGFGFTAVRGEFTPP